MRLEDIESRQILPEFANDLGWSQDAFDDVIKQVVERSKSIDAPLTMEAIEALTEEELELMYETYGVAKYYPSLSRDTRNRMLYEMCRLYRYLGTPKSVETLCKYILDTVELSTTVYDNLAFNERGELIDSDLLDLFDIEVKPFVEELPVDGADRIRENILHFSRNSQTLRNIIYTLPDTDITLNVAGGIPHDNMFACVQVENNNLCEGV